MLQNLDADSSSYSEEDIKYALAAAYGGVFPVFLLTLILDKMDYRWSGYGNYPKLCITMVLTSRRQTVSTLGSFLLGVVLNPHVQERAQRLIDQVCPGRLPSLEMDHDALPYIGAIVKESLRWNPVVPVGTSNIMRWHRHPV